MDGIQTPNSGLKRWVILIKVCLLQAFILFQAYSICAGDYLSRNDIKSESPILMRLAHSVTKQHPTHLMAEEVAKEIFIKTNGKIKLEIFSNMEFGQELELINQVQNGKLDMAIVSTGPLSTFDAAINILDLPYLFSSAEQVNQVLDGEAGQAVLKTLNSFGLVGICYWKNGLRSITTRNTLIEKPTDLLDLKMRVMQNPIYISFFSTLGARPTPMAWGEVIPALKSGIIDAQENPIPVIYLYKLYQFQKYLILTEHTFNSHVVLGGSALRNKLTTAEIDLVYSIFKTARIRQRALINEQSIVFLKLLKNQGMKIIKPDIKEFQRVGREYSKKAITEFSPEIRLYFERYLQ